MVRLDEALRVARLRHGDREHFVDRTTRASFASLDDEATRWAERLKRSGLSAGGRVAVQNANSFRDLAAIFGVWRAGGTLVPVNPRLTESEVRTICDRSRSRLLVKPTGQFLNTEIEPLTGDTPPDADLAAIAFTSGTSGAPKGVEITHANMLCSASAIMQTRRDSPNAIAAMVSPICHLPVFVSHYLARLLSGGAVIAGSFDPEELLRLVASEGITDLPLVPAMVGPLLASFSGESSDRVRKVSVGSAITSMETKRTLMDRFPRAEILEAYGQTESTDGLTMSVGREALDRPGTVGRPHSIITIGVQDPAGESVAAGVCGEIVCRGPTVMRGYLDDKEATANALRNGWLHTGDLGKLDADGFVYVTGRLKEIIISGGENVSPEEVENAIADHPSVKEAAVFGLPDDRWGERVVAAVVIRGHLTSEILSEHLAAKLARFKRPQEIFFVESLPKTAAGKIRRGELRERYSRPRSS